MAAVSKAATVKKRPELGSKDRTSDCEDDSLTKHSSTQPVQGIYQRGHKSLCVLSHIEEGREGRGKGAIGLLNNLDSSAYSALRERLLWKGACGKSFSVNAVPSTSPHSGEIIKKLF